jgi:putative Holliday junction resolvase
VSVETVFAFDFGVKRIGVAMGNTMIRQAQPIKVISAIDNAKRFADIQAWWSACRCIPTAPPTR